MAFTKVQGVFLKTTPQDEDHRIANLYSFGITDNAPSTLLTLSGNTIQASADVSITGDLSVSGNTNFGIIVLPSSASPTPTTAGEATFGTSANAIFIGDGTTTRQISSDSSFSTLTNKTLTAPVLNGSISGTAFIDDDTFAAANSSTIASSESVKAYVDTQSTAQDLDFSTGSGAGAVDLDSQTLAFTDGNGIDITHAGQAVTIGINSTVANSSNKLDFFSATTSAELLSKISDETGSGVLVFGTSPAFTTSVTTGSASFDLINTTATTVNFAGGATALGMGAATGTISFNNPTVNINNASGVLQINGTQVLTTQQTWTDSTPTSTSNTSVTADFDTAFAANTDVKYLAQHVMAIVDVLRTHGLINNA